jgi:nitroreductase
LSHLSRVHSLSRNRQAVRRFADRPVPPELLERILDCGRYSVSAGEDQPWRFIVVQERLTRHRLSEAAFNSEHVKTAPIVLVGCARVHSRISGHGKPAYPTDLAAATQSMALAAVDQGLQVAWITGFRESIVRSLLGVPRDIPVVTLLSIGYPDGFDRLPPRRPFTDVVAWDRWEGGAE